MSRFLAPHALLSRGLARTAWSAAGARRPSAPPVARCLLAPGRRCFHRGAALGEAKRNCRPDADSRSTPTCPSKAKTSRHQHHQHQQPGLTTRTFWADPQTWKRAGVNTFRCLVGCTLGDFSAMWYLQAFHPEVAMESVMAISMASGVATSLTLETVLLRLGRDGLPWSTAAKTAAGMSLISMVTMELAENAVDYHLTGGVVQMDSPAFWLAALLSVSVGFLAPLPYNYVRLRKYGKACH